MIVGGIPERSKGSDCKSDGYAFTGSNPVPPTGFRVPERFDVEKEAAIGRIALIQYVDAIRGRSSMVEPQPSKLKTRVRFPSPALVGESDQRLRRSGFDGVAEALWLRRVARVVPLL
jgi:hypothetical protein